MNGGDCQSHRDLSIRRVQVVNLTGHKLTVGTPENQWTFLSRGIVRSEPTVDVLERVRLMDRDVDTGVNVPLLNLTASRPERLDELERVEDTLYVVSGIVEGVADRTDIWSPGRVHKENGKTLYARALMRRPR